MAELTTTKMSSKGQVVIPEEIRKRLRLEAGTQFVVIANKDTVNRVGDDRKRKGGPCMKSRLR